MMKTKFGFDLRAGSVCGAAWAEAPLPADAARPTIAASMSNTFLISRMRLYPAPSPTSSERRLSLDVGCRLLAIGYWLLAIVVPFGVRGACSRFRTAARPTTAPATWTHSIRFAQILASLPLCVFALISPRFPLCLCIRLSQ
jgi:hypothetical protein